MRPEVAVPGDGMQIELILRDKVQETVASTKPLEPQPRSPPHVTATH